MNINEIEAKELKATMGLENYLSEISISKTN